MRAGKSAGDGALAQGDAACGTHDHRRHAPATFRSQRYITPYSTGCKYRRLKSVLLAVMCASHSCRRREGGYGSDFCLPIPSSDASCGYSSHFCLLIPSPCASCGYSGGFCLLMILGSKAP